MTELRCCAGPFIKRDRHSGIQSNLWIATTEGTGNKLSYFSGGLICQAWFKNFQYRVVHMPLHEPSLSTICSFHRHAGRNWQRPCASRACKRDDRSSGVPAREKLDDWKSVFRSIWRMWSLFPGWIAALGRPPVSAIRISQVVAFSRTHSVHLNRRIEGTEFACPQFSGGRFCQVVARTGSTVVRSVKGYPVLPLISAVRSACDLVWPAVMRRDLSANLSTLSVLKIARNEVENASFAQRSAHHDSRIWRPELIEPAAERKWRSRRRRPTFKSAYPDPQILPQCNISSNYPPIMFGFSESADTGLSF